MRLLTAIVTSPAWGVVLSLGLLSGVVLVVVEACRSWVVRDPTWDRYGHDGDAPRGKRAFHRWRGVVRRDVRAWLRGRSDTSPD